MMGDDIPLSGNEPSLKRQAKDDNLPGLGGETALLHYMEGLQSSDSEVQLRSAEMLAQIGSEHALDILSGALISPWIRVRERASSALGVLGSERALQILLDRVDQDRSAFNTQVFLGLAYYRDIRVIQRLIDLLGDGVNISFQTEALKCMMQMGELAIPPLRQILRGESIPEQINALIVLAGIAGQTEDVLYPDGRCP